MCDDQGTAKLHYVTVRVFRTVLSKGLCSDETEDGEGEGDGAIDGMKVCTRYECFAFPGIRNTGMHFHAAVESLGCWSLVGHLLARGKNQGDLRKRVSDRKPSPLRIESSISTSNVRRMRSSLMLRSLSPLDY